jgi:hypothetical protein
MDQTAQLNETIRKMQAQIDALAKASTFGLPANATTALAFYDLEAQAKLTVPEITPLIRMIPRVKGEGGPSTQWDMVTALNPSKISMGVPSGTRAGVMDVTTSRQTVSYATVGLETSADWQADWAGQPAFDIKGLSVLGLLKAARIGEESIVLGGNATLALGTAPTATLTPSNTGGTLTNAASPYHVRVVALTLAGYKRASMTAGIPTTQSVVSGDGGTNTPINAGASQVSADATATIGSGTTGSIAASCTAVQGAVAYAWFIGTDGTTNCNLAAITTVNAVTLTSAPSAPSVGTGFAGAVGTNFGADRSKNQYVFDGLISIVGASANNAYFKSLDNAQLTTDNAAGCTEINAALQSFWDVSRLSPDWMVMNSQQLIDLNTLIVKNGGAPLFRSVNDDTARGLLGITGGTVVTGYLNKTAMGGGKLIKIMLHPDCPPGMILFYTETIPYATANFTNILQIKAVRDWFQVDWPMTTPKYQYGVYANEVLQCYFPPAFGMICNIKPGVA